MTPTERELRAVTGDFEQSLSTVAFTVMRQLQLPNLLVTMGRRGALMFYPRIDQKAAWFQSRLRSEYMPSLADRVEDVVGAGDALLAGATLALCCGVTLPQAGYVGSAAAAVAIRRIGNLPVGQQDLIQWVHTRPELRHPDNTIVQAG